MFERQTVDCSTLVDRQQRTHRSPTVGPFFYYLDGLNGEWKARHDQQMTSSAGRVSRGRIAFRKVMRRKIRAN